MTGLEPKKVSPRSGDTQLCGSLNVLMEKKPLANVVLEAVRRIDPAELRPVAWSGAGIAFRPRLLLAVVTYCYAAGIYGSDDIEALMRKDATFRFLCGNEFPGWKLIQHFRRLNREIVQRCLEEALRGASEVKPCGHAADRNTTPHTPRPPFARPGGWLDEQFREESEQRMQRAVWMDNLARDDESS